MNVAGIPSRVSETEARQGEGVMTYWRSSLLGAPPALELPTDRPRSLHSRRTCQTIEVALPANLVADLRRRVSQSQTTDLFGVLAGSLALILSRWSSQQDVIIGVDSGEFEAVSANGTARARSWLPLRIDVREASTVGALLREVTQALGEARENSGVPFELLVHALSLHFNSDYHPIFQVALRTNLNAPFDDTSATSDLEPRESATTLDLQLSLLSEGTRIVVRAEYPIELFDVATIERLVKGWLESLTALSRSKDARVAEISILPDFERHKLLDAFNDTSISSTDLLVHQLVEEQTLRTPDAVAVQCGAQRLTYAELNRKSNQLARYLLSQGLKKQKPVALCVERNPDMVVGLLGILKAGGVYVPLDPSYPIERLSYMLEDSAPEISLTTETLSRAVPVVSGRLVKLDSEWSNIARQPSGNLGALEVSLSSRDLAYVIYTSGSTGKPKGVMVEHRGVVNLLRSIRETTRIKPSDRLLAVTTLAFDIAGLEIYLPLVSGACVAVASRDVAMDPFRLADSILRDQISVLQATPSTWRMLIDSGWAGTPALSALCGGEALPSELAVHLQTRVGHLWNVYGPTETTIWSTVQPILDRRENTGRVSSVAPIGRPAANTRIYILDPYGRLVPIGVIGEIHIAGIGIARGYLNRPDLTASRFLADPFAAQPFERMYQTGDLGRWREDGTIEYFGRNDHQVKIRGHRIELSEIESEILRHARVKQAVVVAREDSYADKRLVAYVVPESKATQASFRGVIREAIVRDWQSAWKEAYSEQSSSGEPSFAGWNSSSGVPIPEPQMQEWLSHTIARIRELRPQRVLDIGCGLGLIVQHLAGTCPVYVGTDVSATALKRLGDWVSRRDDLKHVELVQKSAAELEEFETASFDTIVLNSVIQYFPDADYLLAVLREAVRLVQPGGRIFVGDVRHLGLLPLFVSSLQLNSAPDTLTVAKLRSRVARSIVQEKELLLDPGFFHTLFTRLPGIAGVDVQLKRGAAINELTRYRYDVVIEVGESPFTVVVHDTVAWKSGVADIAALKKGLAERRWPAVRLTGVPNVRLAREATAQKLVQDSDESQTVAALRGRLAELDLHAEDPEMLRKLAETHGYEARLRWGASPTDGMMDVEFLDTRSAHAVQRKMQAVEATPVKPVRTYANDPGENRLRLDLVPQLRQSLREQLPPYMVPTSWMVLKELPLTLNGKIDRRVLPVPQDRPEATSEYVAPRNDLERTVADVWAEVLGVDNVGARDNFFELGGHSLLIVQVIERLRRVGLTSDPRNIYRSPVVAEFARGLESSSGQASADDTTSIPTGSDRITPQMLGLVKLESEEIARIVKAVPGGALNIQDIYPLTPLQEGMLFHHLLDGKAVDTYVLQVVLSASSRQKLGALIEGLQAVVNRHEALRAAVMWEDLARPVQVIYRSAALPVREERLDSGQGLFEKIEEWIQLGDQGFELTKAPLMSLTTAEVASTGECWALLKIHHLICDNESLEGMLDEALAHVVGHGPELPEPGGYRRHVSQALKSSNNRRAEDFFKAKLGDLDQLVAPFGIHDVLGSRHRIGSQVLALDPNLGEKVRSEAQRAGVSAATVFHAAWALVVAHLGSSPEAVFGTIFSGRLQVGSSRPVIGMFINTLPLRLRIEGIGARELLHSVYRELLSLLDYEQTSLAVAQRCSGLAGQGPLFTALLNYVRSGPLERVTELTSETGIRVQEIREWTNYPLTLSVNDDGNRFVLTVQADRRIDPSRVLSCVAVSLQSLVHALTAAPDAPASELSILPETERRQVVELFNATSKVYPSTKSVHGLFEQQVRRTPDTIAAVCERETLSYAQLNARANQLSHYLIKRGMQVGDCVPIVIARGLQLLIGQLAVLKCGACYVPIDPELPRERQLFMVRDCGARWLLTEAGDAGIEEEGLEIIECVRMAREIVSMSSRDLALPLEASLGAYVMYTSGSTGVPKGVLIPHHAINRLVINNDSAEIKPSDCVAHDSNPAFDAATLEVWGALLNGARLVIVPHQVLLDPSLFSVLIAENGVTILWLTIGLLTRYADALSFIFPRVRRVYTGGDVVDPGIVARVLRSCGAARLFNAYGPTEGTTFSTTYSIERIETDQSTLPIGKPISNTRVYILDARMTPVPVGVSGEIYIGGEGVAIGYLNRPALTAERFLADPFMGNRAGRLYRTGDLGRWQADGNVEFLGRNDHQVKVRGYRIELGEIEAHLLRHDSVKEAIVMARQDAPGEKRLVAYITRRAKQENRELQTAPDMATFHDELLACVREDLPAYMVPVAIVELNALPLTPNGKVDRRALPKPDPGEQSAHKYESPQGPVEEALARIWRELLGLPHASRRDNFFQLGGHSLMLVQMLEALRREGLFASVRSVYQHPVLADMARAIEASTALKLEVPPNLILRETSKITPEMLPLVRLEQRHIDLIIGETLGGVGNIQDIYPLAPLQEGILFHHLSNEQGGDTYVLPTLLALSSREKLDELIRALQFVADRHDVLRTAILWRDLPWPVQVVHRHAAVPVEEIVLDASRDSRSQLDEWLRPERQWVNLQQAPLMRLQVAPDPHNSQWYALLQMHHLAIDHVALETVIAEVEAHMEGWAHELPDPVPYRTHVAQALAYAKEKDIEGFFRAKLSDVTESTAAFGLVEIRGDGSKKVDGHESLEPALARRIRAQARKLGVSAATIFHAAWGMVMAHTSGRRDVVYGTVLLGRLNGAAGAQHIVGMFINTLPLRLRMESLSVLELMEHTQRELTELLGYEQASLAIAQSCSGVNRSFPLFNTLFNYRHSVSNAPEESDRVKQPTAEQHIRTAGVQVLASLEWTNYPITFSVDDLGVEFELTAQCDKRLNPGRIIGYMCTALGSVIDALENAPGVRALSLPIVPAAEYHEIIGEFNATAVSLSGERLVHHIFEETVSQAPDAVAVLYENKHVTYSELNRRADRLALLLRSRGVVSDHLVGICMGRSVELIVGILSALKAGGAYLPIDPNYPSDRLEYMLSDASPMVVLTDKASCNVLRNLSEEVVVLDTNATLSDPEQEGTVLRVQQSDSSVAYLIYTSGSTGRPKGTAMPHSAMVNLIHWHRNTLRSCCGQRVLQFAALSFDVAFQEIFSTLSSGGTLVLLDEDTRRDATAVLRLLSDQSVERIFVPPMMLQSLVENIGTGRVPRSIRDIITAGEQLRISPEIVGFFRSLGGCHLHNHYGPTETHVVTALTLSGDSGSWPTLPTIGRPISNCQIYILDRDLRPVPIGTIGEIYVGGAGVARGYFHREELTAERFVVDPFSHAGGSRLYKTGDLGRWQSDGAIEYLGRNDAQIKIRGFRVELGEIEAQLARHPQVKEVAVTVREDTLGQRRIVAYVVPRDTLRLEPTLTSEELREHLKAALPVYMVPSAFVILATLPLTPSGKLDRRGLPVPDSKAYSGTEYHEPQGLIEPALATIWQDVLQVQQVSRRDHFFDLGGHSLLALKMVLRANQRLGTSLGVSDVYRNPTVSELAEYISNGSVEDKPVDLVHEAALEPSVTMQEVYEPTEPRTILLTGSTGFIGRFLLDQLLRETSASVYCVVRAPSDEEAGNRVRMGLKESNLWNAEYQRRIVAVTGDLRLPKLGIPSVTYEVLCRDVDTIYHCATSMNHLETYSMAKPANVEACKELLKLAVNRRTKLINYISSLGIFNPSKGDPGRIITEESPIEHEGHRQSSGYQASKWVGEKIFMNATERGIPCNIFRLGLVWADSKEGRFDELQQVYRVLKTCLLSGCGIENYHYEMPPTPVDYVAKAMVFLGTRHLQGKGIFHISSPRQVVEGIFERCNAILGTSLHLLPFYDWLTEIRHLHEQGHVLPAVPLVEYAFSMSRPQFEQHQNANRFDRLQFDCRRTNRELEPAGIEPPSLGDTQLKVTLESMLARDRGLIEVAIRKRCAITS